MSSSTGGGNTAGRRPVPWKTFVLLGLAVALLAASILWWAPRQRRIGAEEGYRDGIAAAKNALEAGDLAEIALPPAEAVAFCDVAAEAGAKGFNPSFCDDFAAAALRATTGRPEAPAQEEVPPEQGGSGSK